MHTYVSEFWLRVLGSLLIFFCFFSGGKLWWVQDGHTQWHTQSHLRTLTYNAATRQPARHVIFLCFDFLRSQRDLVVKRIRHGVWSKQDLQHTQKTPTVWAKETYNMSERDFQHKQKRSISAARMVSFSYRLCVCVLWGRQTDRHTCIHAYIHKYTHIRICIPHTYIHTIHT